MGPGPPVKGELAQVGAGSDELQLGLGELEAAGPDDLGNTLPGRANADRSRQLSCWRFGLGNRGVAQLLWSLLATGSGRR